MHIAVAGNMKHRQWQDHTDQDVGKKIQLVTSFRARRT